MAHPPSDLGGPPAAAAIRDAATVVLLRDGAAGRPEVLLVRRNRGAVFMADAHVFPGGRIEEGDGGDFALASAREAFEEAGVLLAVDGSGSPPPPHEAARVLEARHAVQRNEVDFAALLARHGLRFDPSRMVHFARWITPPTESRRFDARFYLARVPEGQQGAPDPAGEVVDFRWDEPAAFLALQRAGAIRLPPPTLWHLGDLARQDTVESALAWAASRTIVAVRPKLSRWQDEVMIVLPWDPDYDRVPVAEGEAIAPEHPVVSQPITRFVLDGELWRAADGRGVDPAGAPPGQR